MSIAISEAEQLEIPTEKTIVDTENSKTKEKKRKSNYLFLPYKLSRGTFLKWLRRTHAWLGLWGAALGILFGITGILLNHRATIKLAHTERTKIEMPLPSPQPKDTESFLNWLQVELNIPNNWSTNIRTEKPIEISWGGKSVTQPERWRATFSGTQQAYSAEYWLGNSYVTIQRFDRNILAILNRFHMASGVGIGWILLADSIAGSFILLSLTGILLWTRLHGRRLLAASLGLTSLLIAIYIAFSSL